MTHSPDDDPWREYHVTPRYLAGSGSIGDPGFAPVADWPHHYPPDDSPCQLLVTSPDHRIRIGWFGDDYLLWKISAHEDPISPPHWTATFNHTMPAEIVAGLTTALARDYADGNDRFLARPSIVYWADTARPLTDAGWTRGTAEPGTVEITAPDHQAGIRIDQRLYQTDDETWTLWAGPPGWATRAEATFTASTPAHLIAATAAAMADPAPVVRTRNQIHRDIAHLVRLTPVEPPAQASTPAPTPLDVRRSAVTAAVARAAHAPHTDLRVRAAHMRTTTTPPTPNGPATSGQVDSGQGTPSAVVRHPAGPTNQPRR